MRKANVNNPRYPHKVIITRITPPEDEFSGVPIAKKIYVGIGRAFTDTTTTGSADVERNRRKASIPVRFDEWDDAIYSGDIIETYKGSVYEKGIVRDFEPDNNRTLIYWDLIRN